MAESTLSIELTDLEAEVGQFLGWGRGLNFGETAWSTNKQKSIDDLVKSGLRSFYFPAPLPGDSSSYDWSFMRPTRQVLLEAAATFATLPDDFAGMEGMVRLVSSGRAAIECKQTNEQKIRQFVFANPNQIGPPEWCAVESVRPSGMTKGTRSRLLVFPTADQAYTLEFQYYFSPDSLSVSFPYPHGGPTHAETIKAACLAKAELYQDNEPGPMAQNFIDRMKASVSLDRRNKGQAFGYNGDPSYNRGGWRPGWRHYEQQSPITFDGVVPG